METALNQEILKKISNKISGEFIIPNKAIIDGKEFSFTSLQSYENDKQTYKIGLFEDNIELTSIIVSEGITHIDERTFASCSNLSEVKLPESTEKIGAWAFNNCSSLTSITIPKNVNEIEYNAFAYCYELKTVNWESSIRPTIEMLSVIFANCPKLETINFQGQSFNFKEINKKIEESYKKDYLEKALELFEKEGADAAIKYLNSERKNMNEGNQVDLAFAMSEIVNRVQPSFGKGAHIAKFNELFNENVVENLTTDFDNMSLEEVIEHNRKLGIESSGAMRKKIEGVLSNPTIIPDIK